MLDENINTIKEHSSSVRGWWGAWYRSKHREN
jgi:hypothetical protein